VGGGEGQAVCGGRKVIRDKGFLDTDDTEITESFPCPRRQIRPIRETCAELVEASVCPLRGYVSKILFPTTLGEPWRKGGVGKADVFWGAII
jgi:hypothetical protein